MTFAMQSGDPRFAADDDMLFGLMPAGSGGRYVANHIAFSRIDPCR